MLSRVADNLYWMSRYLERAEHTARLLDVNLNQMLDQTPEAASQRWERLLLSLRSAPMDTHDPYAITESLTFSLANPLSIVSCVGQARENARQVREQISTEMWEQINRLFLQVRRTRMDEIWHAEPHEFFKAVKEGAHLFQGITDGTISHGEGWHFIQIGRYIERASATAALLDTHFTSQGANDVSNSAPDYLSWVGLLKSCTAFEAYCRVYTADIQPARIAEFLVLDTEFPRSICCATEILQESLQAIARTTRQRHAGRTERLAGRLRAALDYTQVEEIMEGDMHSYLESIQRQCSQIHDAIHQTYITYSADVALAS